MKCPLFNMALINDYERRKEGDADCLKGECDWWIPQVEACSVHITADLIGNLVVHLKNIASRTPLGGK